MGTLLLLLLATEPTPQPRAPLHWAFQPLRPQPGSIDGFLEARFRQAGLRPNPSADRATLIRRLKFDLLGLPPTPEEVVAFVADRRPDAYERLVDRYLASPHFGERVARHWLDVVRFAETTGFETNAARPNAWPYRDYVIRAFNDDRPYTRFVREQLAGDQLGEDAATGFLVAGAYDQVKGDPALNAQQRADELHDMIAVTGSAFLGLTTGCARCHEHKFDPIPQRDYYALKAVFAGVQHAERTPTGAGTVSPLRNEDRFAPIRAVAFRMTILATNNGSEPCIDELELFAGERNIARTATPTASGTYPGSAIHRLEHLNDGRYGNSASWISNTPGSGWVGLTLTEPATVDRIVWGRDREGRFSDRVPTHYRLEVATAPGRWQTVKEVRSRPTAALYAGAFTPPPEVRRLHRGENNNPREVVAPGTLSSFAPVHLPASTPEAKRRLALADWIVDAKNPLTARVIVNRLWQQHFGVGLVATPSDLGRNGAAPSHPELLDHLAGELIASGWSLKTLHRKMVLSDAYRRSSARQESALKMDSANRLLWRFPSRRLEAEPLRDAMLSVTGRLDTRMGGPGFDLFESRGNSGQGVKIYVPRRTFGPEHERRMIYQFKPRMRLDDTFGVFDCPDAGQPAATRPSSTTALQVLSLTNSPFALKMAEAFAERLQREADAPAAQVRRGFWLAFGRAPEAEEESDSVAVVREHGLMAFTRALLAANEFLYVD
jgi:hypothetical protein